MTENNILQDIVFGSTSDKDKVLPGIIRATKEFDDLEIIVHFASADNTPAKLQRILRSVRDRQSAQYPEDPKIYISGAGMSNLLTGVEKVFAGDNDLVIGVPITDRSTGGTSSFLSTSEKPPYNPVITAGLNNSYAALRLAYNFRKSGFDKLELVMDGDEESLGTLLSLAESHSIPHMVVHPSDVSKDSLVLSSFGRNPKTGSYKLDHIRTVDNILAEGSGFQVSLATEINDLHSYSKTLDGLDNTGVVSKGIYINAIYAAAKLLRHENALSRLNDERFSRAEKVRTAPSLRVYKGVVD